MPEREHTSPIRASRAETCAGRTETRAGRAEVIGAASALALIAVAIAVPPLTGWEVKALSFPPLFAELRPRFGPGSIFAVVIGVAVALGGFGLARRTGWWALLALMTLTSAAWMLSLDAIDGFGHLGGILDSAEEYLPSARALAADGLLSSVPDLLTGYVARIPLAAPDNLPVHLAGHPPGAVLFFALLLSCGVSSTWAIGLVVTLLAATIPAAVMSTLRSLGAEAAARSIAPFLVCAPAAIWLAVSADAVFATTGAWAVAVLVWGTVRPEQRQATRFMSGRAILGGLVSGVLLGLGTYASYGFPLLGLVVLAVFVIARNLRSLPWLIGGGLIVVALFTLGGFEWWEAYPVLRDRYFDGFAASRPPVYWLWANLAALLCATGPALGAGIAVMGTALLDRSRAPLNKGSGRNVVFILSVAAVGMVVAADLSSMSRAEVERIWLFMVPWLLVSLAAVSERSRTWLLSTQLAFTLVLVHLMQSAW
ncbi:hypothetical protein [Brevibacterium atlanticum]|uniref:hypothetical protein n=1 Tax=Brevibacterium atlanticum TaxID=2697563 RepID=UPI00141FA4F8|nr:hypothetical protein [Brevibacterium atlanticum]